MSQRRFTILGCGSSGGVPRIGGHWGDCDPLNPKNRRSRCSLLVEQTGPDGTTRVLVDTSPDLRNQLLAAEVGSLDGVIFTHAHADHIHGIDDLRMVVINMRKRLGVWAAPGTRDKLLERFSYVFIQPEGSTYPPILEMNTLDGEVRIPGAGGEIPFRSFEVQHGNVDTVGFRIGDVAYLPDVASIPDTSLPALEGLDLWIVDALRRDPHPTHFHLARALEWIDKMAPKEAIITNMHIDMDYETLLGELPSGVVPAYDGMTWTDKG